MAKTKLRAKDYFFKYGDIILDVNDRVGKIVETFADKNVRILWIDDGGETFLFAEDYLHVKEIYGDESSKLTFAIGRSVHERLNNLSRV